MRALLAFAVAACSTPEEEPVRPDTSVVPLCHTTVTATEPEGGVSDHFKDYPIVFELSEPDPTATVIAPVAGTTTVSETGHTYTFTPDEPLAPSTPYTFRFEWCDGAVDLAFITADLGSSPVTTSLMDRTYAVSFGDGVSADASDLLPTLADTGVLFQVTGEVDGRFDLLVAPMDFTETAQDYCIETGSATAALDAEPTFEAELGDALLALSYYRLPLLAASLTATMAPDGTWFAGGTLRGAVDTRALMSVFPGEVCGRAPIHGVACEACPDGEPFCLPVVIERLEGFEVSEALVPIPSSDCQGCGVGPPLVCL